MRAGGFPGNPGGLVVSIVKTAGARAPAHQARGRGRRTWRPTERTAGARMVPPGEGNEARGDGRRGVGVSHSTAEAGELSPRDPVEGRGHRQVAPLEGKTANTPRLGPVSTSRQRIAELARQAVGMAVAIAWLPGPAGTRRRVAKLSVEEPDAAEPARPDLWGARVSNDPGLPDLAPAARDPPAAIHQPDPDRSPVEILPSPNRRGVVILGRASATFSTPWFSPRRRDRDQDFIGTIHGDPTDVQLRDTEELLEYRCEAHGDLRLTVESRNQTLQHVPVRALSINPTRSTT